ncbi:MAG TPA: DUF362 domain-containing protein [Candidatus Saccharimonadales bacterium]|nr:DUF362 domain-containing protein [Candidatus Saccharimonadales bacterium]
MSTSSVSKPLDRRGFLRLGAGALAAASAAFQWGCNLTTRACKSVPPNPFVAAGKPLLVVVQGEDVGAMLHAGIEALGGLDPLTKLGREAIFRGNYVAAQPYPVTTAPDFVLAVAAELKRAGLSKTSLFDSHGTRLGATIPPDHILRHLGVLDKLTQGGVPVLARDFSDPDEFVFVRNPAWPIAKPVAVHRLLNEAPIVVSLPVVKRHRGGANFTCALKMHFGSVSMADRMLVHSKDDAGRSGLFQQRLVHFADTVRPQLNVVDARSILARSGPGLSGGAEVIQGVNKLILSGDMVAVDAYCARLMAQHDETFSLDTVASQLKHAATLGLGKADLDDVKVVEIRA